MRRLIIVVAGLTFVAIFVLFVAQRDRRSADQRPNVLLITVDTLRADHLGCYGHRLETSPTIDQFVKQGIRFTDCTVQRPKTRPSMASLMTGTYPKTMRLQSASRAIPESSLVMAEIFRQAGYHTAAVVANFNVGNVFNFDQGFDSFTESWQENWEQLRGNMPFRNRPGKVKFFTNATIVTNQGLKSIRSYKGDKPFFVWLHYMDPHGPYLPPRRYANYFKGAYDVEEVASDKLPKYQLQFRPETRKQINDVGFYRTQYNRLIRYFDDEFGRLLYELKELGLDKNTIIVFTADHGESLGEHDYYLEHGRYSYQVNARVPLIVVQEGVIPKDKTVDSPVGLIDLTPTILELAGIDVPPSFEGHSLVELIHSAQEASTPRHVFMESGRHPQRPQLTVRQDQWKLIHVISPQDRQAITGFTTVILLQLIIGSMIMLALGIIGIYISKIYSETKRRPRYVVAEMLEPDARR